MNCDIKTLICAFAAASLMIPATAVGQGPMDEMAPVGEDDADDIAEDALEGDERPWSLSGSVRMSVGQGTFARIDNNTQYADEVHDGSGAFNRVGLSFGLSPSYEWNDFSFSGQIGFSQSLTAGSGGANEPYQTRMSDIEASAGWKGYEIEALQMRITPSARVMLPASARSRHQTMIASTSAGVSLSRNFFGKLGLSYGVRGSRTFHQYTSPVINIDDIGEENALYRVDGTEAVEPGRFAVDGINTQWGLSHSLSAQFMFSQKVMGMISYSFSSGWAYNIDRDDEFASELECEGRCARQSVSGMIGLNYIVTDNIALSAGLNTPMQSPKSGDQQTYNFPFWNFNGAASNRSSISLGLIGSY